MVTEPILGRRTLSAIFFLAGLMITGSVHAASFERRVLGLYSSAEGKTEVYNPLRGNTEMVLNHLGLKLEYHDLETGVPEASVAESYRGFLIWLDGQALRNPDVFWSWVGTQLAAGRRVVFLGGIAPLYDAETGKAVPLQRVNAALSSLGLRLGSYETDLPLDIELLHKQPEIVEFERSLTNELSLFREQRSIDPSNVVHLKLRQKSSGAESDAVVVSPSGGAVAAGYLMYADPVTARRQWRVNPFAFLSETLGVRRSPRPDVTTLFGRRLFYTHIDGDGIANRSLATRVFSGKIVLEEILEAYPEIPFTVSVIGVEVDTELRGSKETQAIARSSFRLPNVEAASHTFTHPLVWNVEMVPDEEIQYYEETVGGIVASGRAILPWSVPGYEFDPVAETALACRQVEDLLPPGKTCRLLLWSGNCLPDEETLRVTTEAGLLNMNGGDARFDGAFPSYAYVTPLYRQSGSYYQIHSSNSNENTYTDLWRNRFGAFQTVLQTFENTESPRRVSPINVYYHFYSAERPAGLHALKRVYQWVKAQNTFPVYASRYAEMVLGFIETEIDELRPGVWGVRQNGACRTIRFDTADHVDVAASTGVLGYRRYQGALYVTLDDSDDHVIVLADLPDRSFHLVESSADVSHFEALEKGFAFRSTPFGPSRFVWKNAGADVGYEVTVLSGNGPQTTVVRSDNAGMLLLNITQPGPLTIRVVPDAESSS